MGCGWCDCQENVKQEKGVDRGGGSRVVEGNGKRRGVGHMGTNGCSASTPRRTVLRKFYKAVTQVYLCMCMRAYYKTF